VETGSCSCGSGLARPRCCGLDPAGLPGPAALALLEPQALDSTKLFNERQYSAAETLALKLLDLAPNLRPALRVLFEIRKAQGRVSAAEALARRLAGLPGTPVLRAAAATQLAQFLISQGRYAEAEAPAAQAVIAAPRDAAAQHLLGMVLTETGRPGEGEHHYRNALEAVASPDGLMLGNLAWNLKLEGRLAEAATLYGQALTLHPDNPRGLGGFAQVEYARGNVGRALELLESGLARWPANRTLRLLRALVDAGAGDADAVLARLPEAPEPLLAPELLVRGRALERWGGPPRRWPASGSRNRKPRRIPRCRRGWRRIKTSFPRSAWRHCRARPKFLLRSRYGCWGFPAPARPCWSNCSRICLALLLATARPSTISCRLGLAAA
jgi:tetratricopeptide (TPR) repeat protein